MSRRTGPGGRLRPSPRAHRAGRDQRHPPGHQRSDGTTRSAGAPDFGEPVERAPLETFGATTHAGDVPERVPDVAAVEPAAAPADRARSAQQRSARVEAATPVPDVAGARPPGGSGRTSQSAPRDDTPDSGADGADGVEGAGSRAACTAPQLRRFIKSRSYVPMHELRRRFSINGHDDDVCPVDVDGHRIYVGLPAVEGRLLGELLRSGDVGYELSMDPETPVVVGVYAMRPVSRA